MTEMGPNHKCVVHCAKAVFQTLSFSDASGLNMWGDKAGDWVCCKIRIKREDCCIHRTM